jgi:hypothetical protein
MLSGGQTAIAIYLNQQSVCHKRRSLAIISRCLPKRLAAITGRWPVRSAARLANK